MGKENLACSAIGDLLLCWFDRNRRSLPWRRDYAPYRVWISEIMLQQTQVKTVVPYYLRWMDRFPDLRSVAAASEEEILKCWEGLGYYKRAANIHRAAQILVKDHGGEIPRDHGLVSKLPGVGPYTAGAIMSLAFNESYAAVDGNVERVVARMFDVSETVRSPQARRLIQSAATRLIPEGRARSFNQALMELGACICTPKDPDCRQCPVSGHCISLRMGIVDKRPVRGKRKPCTPIEVAIGVIVHGGRILIQKRPPQGLMANLWEFPGGKVEAGESPKEAVVRELWEEVRMEVSSVRSLGSIRHSYTSFRVVLHAYLCELVKPDQEPLPRAAVEVRWVDPSRLDDYAFPTANRRLIPKIQKMAESSFSISEKMVHR